jgi:hypothetical protein
VCGGSGILSHSFARTRARKEDLPVATRAWHLVRRDRGHRKRTNEGHKAQAVRLGPVAALNTCYTHACSSAAPDEGAAHRRDTPGATLARPVHRGLPHHRSDRGAGPPRKPECWEVCRLSLAQNQASGRSRHSTGRSHRETSRPGVASGASAVHALALALTALDALTVRERCATHCAS